MTTATLVRANSRLDTHTGVNAMNGSLHAGAGINAMPRYRPQFVNRLAMLASLRDGWDGPTSVRPDRAGVSLFWEAMDGLVDLQKRVGLGSDPDGAVSIEWDDADGVGYVASVRDGRAHFMVFPTDGSILEREIVATPEAIRSFALRERLPNE